MMRTNFNFIGLEAPQKVSMGKLKLWFSESLGMPLWLIAESQRFAGSLNEALALVLGAPEGEVSRLDIEQGFAQWGGWTDGERRAWVIRVLVSMEVDDRRRFMALLNGRLFTGSALAGMAGMDGAAASSGTGTEMAENIASVSVKVRAVLLYVRPMGRSVLQYELTFGLRTGEESGASFVGCFKAVVGMDEAGVAIHGLTDELSLLEWIGSNLGERIGPIRGVRVSEVFELHCDGVQWSKRHKAGFKAERVRVVSWLRDTAGVSGLWEVRDCLPRPQDSGQSG